ncbi:MAG: sulfate adenylyltransferase [Candidatus Omnitrophica bacterium]|nr:sulfate adenylyltransferase [Candidatus Omnitrophota bacterium]
MDGNSILAHGGCGLIDRFIPKLEREVFLDKISRLKVYNISNADLSIFYRIADGGLSPLEGPMARLEFNKVLADEYIERNGKPYAWTIPLAFAISKSEADNLEVGETVVVRNESQEIIGSLEISDIYPFDKTAYNKSVYGTERIDHPGPRIFSDDQRDYLLGGKILALPQKLHPEYGKYMLTPSETREIFKKKGWQKIVAFQTRNALHRAHEYALVHGAEELTREGFFTGVVLNPLVGATKSDDVPADIRMKTYEVLIENKLLGQGDKDSELWKSKGYDLGQQLMLIGLDMKMFYAGPKEAIMHAIYRQNYGFSNIIIGRKHADAPFDDGAPAWGDFDAQEKFSNLNGALIIEPIKVGFAAYFQELGRVGLVEESKGKGYKQILISGKELRKKLQNQEVVDERVMRKPVSEILAKYYSKR